ncbi:spatacsin [Diabrotica undecimpunctata]|uniref:spatacsin n=1 Tax=Diabrotica undecimpunctata TaxID=50387 RepID=UPI003B63E1D0
MTSEDFSTLRPPPPPNLSKENVGIWVGWCCKGDREVAREAAAKGIPVDLVVLFISQRKRIRSEEAENFFRDEVFIWVKELLDRKQIFRVSHILTNIGVDPQEELSKVFCSTTNIELREYIGNHLKSHNKLDENLQQLWHFLDVILKNNVLISKWKLTESSIDCLNKQEHEWKSQIASKLFLRTHDISLIAFMTREALWKQLLAYNDIKLLKIWINVHYNETHDNFDVSENLLKVFKKFSITNEMINQLNSSETSTNTSNVILNDLSQFGIFCHKDLDNFSNIVYRLYQSNHIQNTFQIIRKYTSNISEHQFLHLLVDHCIKNNLHVVLSACVENFDIFEDVVDKNRHLDLILDFRKLTQQLTEQNIKNNIFKVSTFLSSNLEKYFNKNPLIMLSLIFFTENVNVESILGEKVFQINDVVLKESVENLPKKLKYLNAIVNRKDLILSKKITFYDLLQKHYKVDVRKLYAFQFENKSLPDFNNIELRNKFGYLKKVNYLFYVKQFRPSIASKLFLINQYENFKGFPEGNVKQVQKKIYKTVFRDFTNKEMTSSCIAFLEMIGVDSNFLRVAAKCANILLENGTDMDSINNMFMNIENSPYTILSLIEPIVIKAIDFDKCVEGSYFVEAMKTYDIVVKFTIYFDLKLPEMFLRSCATNNMWLPFLIFAQLKNYPIDHLKPILQSFKNPNLLEHLNHSVIHDIQVDDQNVLMRERDSRNFFLSRIGVRKSLENLSHGESFYSLNSQSSYGSNSSSGGSDFLEIDISNTKATLLQTLIRCHNSTDPPRALLQACQLYKNPLLAIFATSYEPDSIINCWLTWLAVSCSIYEMFTNFESVALNSHSVANLLNNCMKHRFPKTLLQSFEIFIPGNALRYFLEFLNLCLNGARDTTFLTSKLETFKSCVGQSRRFSIITDNDHEMTYLTNKIWLESTALDLLSSALQYNMNSFYEQILLIELLSQMNLKEFIRCPDLSNLLEILKIIHGSNSDIRFDIEAFLHEKDELTAVDDCLKALLNNHLFEAALKIAKIQDIPVDIVLVKQWEYKFENRDGNEVEFWLQCNKEFELHSVSADCVVEYFLKYIEKVETNIEKYHLLKLAHQWSKKYDLPSKHSLERDKWLMYLNLEEKWRAFDCTLDEESAPNILYKEMVDLLSHIPKYDGDISSDALNLLRNIINDVLDSSNLWLALKLEKIFGCDNPNLDTLKLCNSLAEGSIAPHQLNTDQRLLITKGTHYRKFSQRRTFLSARLSGLSSASHSPVNSSMIQPNDVLDAPVQDTLAVLCTLAEKVTNGVDMAQTIFMTYRISINIEIPYNLIVSNTDSMKILRDALEDDCLNKLEVIHDFFCVYKWTKEQIADFICEEIIISATKYVTSYSDQYVMWDLKMDQDFHLVLQLLQDNCSLLGHKIYAYASATHKSQVLADLDFKISKLALVVELLISAHDCFTADCNMEGISIILKKCQSVISHLLTLRSWKLIVRLLTGIGRYTEMNYVFQILREHDQFEFLLRKGSRKDNNLKTALLEYLKKYCPDNKELYKIVALHFTLFSEVALLWEREAHSIIKNLIAVAKLEMQNNRLNPDAEPFILLSNTDGTKICLNKAIENYTHATEFHLQGEKLAKAMNSAKQAELIALQISMLKGLQNNATALCLLNLTHHQIGPLITNNLSFDQTLILVQAYNYEPDWSSVLFAQCILKTDNNYLQSFMQHLSLTESLVNDISRKFLTANSNSRQEVNNMKTILNKLPSVHTKYRIASELSFTDIVEDLIMSGQLAYLKDTVWKRGYNN